MGLALLYGGWRCVAKGLSFAEESQTSIRSVRRGTNASGLPLMVGSVMLILGAAIGGIAVVPTGWIDKVYRISPPVTGDGDSDTNSSRLGNWL